MARNLPNQAEIGKIIPFAHPNRPEPTRTSQTNKTTPNATPNAHHFRYAGQRWRIYRRGDGPDAPWYLEFERARRRYKASLGTASRQHAEVEAKSHIDAFLKRRRDDRSGLTERRASGQHSTIGELLAVVPSLPITAKVKTRGAYAWSLRWVLRRALDLATDAEVDAQSAAVLNKATAQKFFAGVIAEAARQPTQASRNTFLRNATSIWASSLALFAPLPLDAMREQFSIRLPDLAEFRAGRKLYLRERVQQSGHFARPSDAVVRRTLVEWVRMARTPGYTVPGLRRHGPQLSDLDRRNAFIAAGLALSCGLRAGEFVQARWSWFTTQNGRPLLSAVVDVKNRSGALSVRPVDPFWRVLNFWVDRNGWRSAPDDYCLEARPSEPGGHGGLAYTIGGHCDRTWWPRYIVGRWLRNLGWTTQKTNHALRDLAASFVTMKFGLHRAQIFCRHGQMQTTQAHYNQFVDEDIMDNPRALAWFTWAK